MIIVFRRCFSRSEKGLKNSALNGDSNTDLCAAGEVLKQLSYQTNWEQVVMWVDYKPVDVEIEDDNTRKIPVLPSTALSITNLNTPCQKNYFSVCCYLPCLLAFSW